MNFKPGRGGCQGLACLSTITQYPISSLILFMFLLQIFPFIKFKGYPFGTKSSGFQKATDNTYPLLLPPASSQSSHSAGFLNFNSPKIREAIVLLRSVRACENLTRKLLLSIPIYPLLRRSDLRFINQLNFIN